MRTGEPTAGFPAGPVRIFIPNAAAQVRPCNNGCRECKAEPAWLGALPLDQAPPGRDAILCGYEPLMNPRLFPAMRALRQRGTRIAAIVTNGRLCVYEQVVQRIADAEVGVVVVKVFGTTPDEHDAHTGVPGSFEQALDGVRRLRAAGVRVALTFPRLSDCLDPARTTDQQSLDLAYRLTNTAPVVFPREGPLRAVTIGASGVSSDHPGGFRYDAMLLTREEGVFAPPLLPMIHVPVGMRCNNRCLYCNVRGGEDPGLHERAYIETLLVHAARTFLPRGPAALDFIGGEPTLHPRLPAMVSKARELGFPYITVCTNGRRLAHPRYLDRLVEAGVQGVRFSMHDHRPDRAGILAGRPEAGAKYLKTARLLLSRTDLTPYFYRILLTANLDGLADHLRWLSDHNRTGRPVRVHLGLPSSRGRMFENPSLFPPLDRVRAVVRHAVRLAADLGIETSLFHAPGCLLPEAADRSAILHVQTVQVDARSDAVVRLQFEGDARHETVCEHCAAREQCPGLPRAYHDADPVAAAAWPIPFARL